MTNNNSTGGCPKCAGQAACWCPPARVGLDYTEMHAALYPMDVANLDAQCLALVEQARKEERELIAGEVEARGTTVGRERAMTHAAIAAFIRKGGAK